MLHLDEHQRDGAGVVNAVGSPLWDVDRVAAAHLEAAAVQGDHPFSGDHEPVLGTTGVPLVAEALFRADLDRLDLETVPLGQDGIGAPRAHGRLSHRIILPDATATVGAARVLRCDQQFRNVHEIPLLAG